MVLSKPAIKDYIKRRRLRFEPAVAADQIKQVSVDLRLGRRFARFKKGASKYIVSIRMHQDLWKSLDLWEEEESNTLVLAPQELVLAYTLEKVSIPEDLVGFVEGRSSYARLGVSVHMTAPKIDPGWSDPITLEMSNFGEHSITLEAGVDMPAQLMFMRIKPPLPAKELYGKAPGATFRGQPGPIPRSNPRKK